MRTVRGLAALASACLLCAPSASGREVVAPAPGGVALALVSRDEGCGVLLDELPIAADGTPGSPRRLTAAPLGRRDSDGDRFTVLDADGPRPALVTCA
jgi:hypothetical protein